MSLYKRKDESSQFWWTRFYAGGKEIRVSTGETDRRRAISAAARIKLERQGQAGPRDTTAVSAIGSLAALAKRDIAEAIERGTSQIHQDSLQGKWLRILRTFGPDTPPSSITNGQLVNFINARRAEGIKGQSIRRDIAALRRALTLALKWKWIAALPEFPKIQNDDKGRKAGKLIAPDVIRAVLREVSPDARPAVEFAAHTGLRFAEICRVEAKFIEPAPHGSTAAAILRLPGPAAKNRRSRTIGLSKRALEIAKAQTGPMLFPHRHYSQALSRACVRLHLPYSVTMRDLRHTFASNALKASGGDLSAVSKALGHSEVETTALYLHSSTNDVLSLATHMDAILGPAPKDQRKGKDQHKGG
jgi:integrase